MSSDGPSQSFNPIAGGPVDQSTCPVTELLERTRVARGLPLTLNDPAIIQKVARIVTLGGAA